MRSRPKGSSSVVSKTAPWIAVVVLCVLPMVFPSFVAQAVAQDAAPYIRMGSGAREMALGNAMAADRSGFSGGMYNPALAALVAEQRLEGTRAAMAFDRRLDVINYSTGLPPRAGVFMSLIHAGVDGIDGRDRNGFHTETISTSAYAVQLGFGIRLSSRLAAGIGLQVFRSELYETMPSVKTIALDIGVNYAVSEQLAIGLVIDDALGRFTWDSSGLYGSDGRQSTDVFPRRVRLGMHWDVLWGSVYGEVEQRLSTRSYQVDRLEVLSGRPTRFTDETTLRQVDVLLRAGIDVRLTDFLHLRTGVDQLPLKTHYVGVRPAVGFGLVQPVGNVLLRMDYATIREPYVGSFAHVVSLEVVLP